MSKKIEVCFVTSVLDNNVASYRIWVKDLAKYFNELGIKTYVNKIPDNIKNNVIIILGKSDVHKCEDYKKKYPNNLIGIINPESGILYSADFIIVGSTEEKDSLDYEKNEALLHIIRESFDVLVNESAKNSV